MSEFLFLFIGGEEYDPETSPDEFQANMQKWYNWIGEMTEQGIYKGGNPLEPTGKTLSGMDKVVTDGPFAEAKEVVGGYVLVETPDIDSAVDAAGGCPIFETGGRVEVRPIMPVNQ